MARRSRRALETAVDSAAAPAERAQACYALALFRENNSREAEAIPLYREAIAHGLPVAVEAEAQAWFASSLMKTGASHEGARAALRARELSADAALLSFLDGLDRRLRRRTARRLA